MIRICYIYWELNAQSDSACLAQARQNRSGKEIGLNRLFYVQTLQVFEKLAWQSF